MWSLHDTLKEVIWKGKLLRVFVRYAEFVYRPENLFPTSHIIKLVQVFDLIERSMAIFIA